MSPTGVETGDGASVLVGATVADASVAWVGDEEGSEPEPELHEASSAIPRQPAAMRNFTGTMFP
jgi:hypothetical protein